MAPGPHLPVRRVVKSRSGEIEHGPFFDLRTSHGDRIMEARFIYRNRSDVGFYDGSMQEMRGGPDKVIVFINGVL